MNSLPQPDLPNGPAMAALFAAGAGSCAMGVFYVAATVSPALNRLLSIYEPTGALSGVSAASILIWLLLWFALDRLWKERDVNMKQVGLYALLLLGAGLPTHLPPVARLF